MVELCWKHFTHDHLLQCVATGKSWVYSRAKSQLVRLNRPAGGGGGGIQGSNHKGTKYFSNAKNENNIKLIIPNVFCGGKLFFWESYGQGMYVPKMGCSAQPIGVAACTDIIGNLMESKGSHPISN